ncbi:MAG TPA: hypothetical protein PLK34_02340, partial [Candidatus Pacearchaeota archaeon]|nr:hypothetical protein [Candidatus Pacearchaeota archaeon]
MPLEKKLDKVSQKENTKDLVSEVKDIIMEVYGDCYNQVINRGVKEFVIYRTGEGGLEILSVA